MFFVKLFYFLKGYVIIEAEGLFIERFINICIYRKIKLRSIEKTDKTKVRMIISCEDFKKLRPIARKSGVRVKILKKCGLFALFSRYKKRYMFFIGALLFILFFAVTTRFVWIIEINGANHLQKALILEVLEEEGLFIGAKKSEMSPPREIKDSLMRNFSNVTWAWAYVEGSKVRIEIHEGTLPPTVVDKSIACDVVAMRDGLIKSITVKQGKASVAENTAVMAGDVLIAGTVLEKEDGSYKTVHATGEVVARTWHEKTGRYMLFNEHRIPTGNKISGCTLNLFSKTFELKPLKNTFREYDTFQKNYEARIGKKYHLGLGIKFTECLEVETVREPIPYESAVLFAEYDLEQKIAEELLPGAILSDRKTTVKNIDDETIEVTLLMEFTEKIGTQKIIDTN